MKILVRLPNWLGDVVMAVGFIDQLQVAYPEARIDVIIKKGLEDIIEFFPGISDVFIFNKENNKGIRGLWNFGRSIRSKAKYDLFFCLPNSFSSALMGFATNARKRIGYRYEGRSFLLTHAYDRPENLHRVDEYVHLLASFKEYSPHETKVLFKHTFKRIDNVIININSEASSRRLSKNKAVSIISKIYSDISFPLSLIGSPKEKAFIESVISALPPGCMVENLAGKTSLKGLMEKLATAQLVISTDSGPAHLSNAFGTNTIVLFGAGNEKRTSPYNKENLTIIRLGELACEPCEKNICVRFGLPQCLEQLDINYISKKATEYLQ